MKLLELETILSMISEPTLKVAGFGKPHSYRGNYYDLAFEPLDTTVGDMLECVKEANGSSYTGYKGGSFEMDCMTDVHLAYEGCSGEILDGNILTEMLLSVINQ